MKAEDKESNLVDKAVSKAVDYEVTLVDMARRSERRAWFIALAAILMALILAAGYFLILPLKEKVPYLVMADAYTGTSTVARLREDAATQSITTSEAINRSNVSHYILARESYDWSLIGNRDWNTVFAMSSQGVAAAYKQLFDRTDPQNLATTYGRNKAIRIRILSLQLFGGGVGAVPKSAVVRFQRFVYDKAKGSSTLMDNRIATMEFTYKPYLEMEEEYRIENPLGFWVTNYRVDNDAALPPVEAAPKSLPQTVEATVGTPAEDAVGHPGQVAAPVGAQPPQGAPGIVRSARSAAIPDVPSSQGDAAVGAVQ